MITVCSKPYCTRITEGFKLCEFHRIRNNALTRQRKEERKIDGICVYCSRRIDKTRSLCMCSVHLNEYKDRQKGEKYKAYVRAYQAGKRILAQYQKAIEQGDD